MLASSLTHQDKMHLLGATKARQALAEGTGAPLHTSCPILALGALTQPGLPSGTGRHLAQLSTAGPRVCWAWGWGSPLPTAHSTHPLWGPHQYQDQREAWMLNPVGPSWDTHCAMWWPGCGAG